MEKIDYKDLINDLMELGQAFYDDGDKQSAKDLGKLFYPIYKFALSNHINYKKINVSKILRAFNIIKQEKEKGENRKFINSFENLDHVDEEVWRYALSEGDIILKNKKKENERNTLEIDKQGSINRQVNQGAGN